jgi:mRNA (guanine-N7-)-methyltransferase
MSVQDLSKESTLANFVSMHYSKREDVGMGKRSEDDAELLRYLNNWIKSVLLKHFVHNISQRKLLVLDLCCGKGGDLTKWARMNVGALWMADIARNSVNHAVSRYNDMKFKFPIRTAAVDCARYRLETIPGFYPKKLFFDLVSCQFSFHYCFESEQRARAMLMNISDRLKSGGIFIATIPDANVLVRNCRESDAPDGSFGNSKFRVRFTGQNWDAQKHELNLPIDQPFGIKYYFTLSNAVEDCPEFLVHFPTLEKLAAEYGLRLVYKANFHQIYFKYSDVRYPELRELLLKMVYKQNGTFISPDEWRIAYMYLGCVFEKAFKPGENVGTVESECFNNCRDVLDHVGYGYHQVDKRDIFEVS